jgi:hypothetical protein
LANAGERDTTPFGVEDRRAPATQAWLSADNLSADLHPMSVWEDPGGDLVPKRGCSLAEQTGNPVNVPEAHPQEIDARIADWLKTEEPSPDVSLVVGAVDAGQPEAICNPGNGILPDPEVLLQFTTGKPSRLVLPN